MPTDQTVFDYQNSNVFLLAATSFYECARLFRETHRHPELRSFIPGWRHGNFIASPVYANSCQGIELAFKGYLRAKGKTIKELRGKELGGNNGHDLVKLYTACQNLGMESFTAGIEEQAFVALSKAHTAKESNFPDIELNRSLPPIDKALDFCRRAIEAANTVAQQGSWKHHNLPTAEPSYRGKQNGGK
jgi:hypothetical protein